jgi:hypothetical protein
MSGNVLNGFSGKDIRTSIKIVKRLLRAGRTIDDLFNYSIDGSNARRKRTKEEKLIRKRLLEEQTYGRVRP